MEGRLTAKLRWARQQRRSESSYNRYVEERLANFPTEEDRRLYAHFYAQDLPVPDVLPAFQSLLVDQQDYLWVERYRLPWENVPTWDILDTEGRWLGTIQTPTRLTIFEIGSDYVLGRYRDELGIQKVRLHTLHR